MSIALTATAFAMHLNVCGIPTHDLVDGFPRRAWAHAMAESGLHPLAIHDNTTDLPLDFDTIPAAIAEARELLAAGHRIDAGIMQITDRNWSKYGLTIETVFEAQANICVGGRILAEDIAIERRAACRYQSGRPNCSPAYPDTIDRIEAGMLPQVQTAPSEPQPPSWDLWARAEYQERQQIPPLPKPTLPQQPIMLSQEKE
jgi:hypothetical protein